MTLGQRLQERIEALSISQSELARRTQIPQTTINSLVRGQRRSTPHLVRLARELQTSPSYLMGETNDPEQDALRPPPEPRLQLITMPVVLPTEAALARMFVGLLRPFELGREDELARTLARQLPKGLQRLQGQLTEEAGDDRDVADAEAPPNDRLAPRQATRT